MERIDAERDVPNEFWRRICRVYAKEREKDLGPVHSRDEKCLAVLRAFSNNPENEDIVSVYNEYEIGVRIEKDIPNRCICSINVKAWYYARNKHTSNVLRICDECRNVLTTFDIPQSEQENGSATFTSEDDTKMVTLPRKRKLGTPSCNEVANGDVSKIKKLRAEMQSVLQYMQKMVGEFEEWAHTAGY